jgi:hypothetical protein
LIWIFLAWLILPLLGNVWAYPIWKRMGILWWGMQGHYWLLVKI